ncbi:alpha/beta hydrolase [Altererythrobacter sp. ZODW24]|uniref:alpha/beta fold hydrolase n=1 Tax=Altererythrobacter sp. ZODW24 TaxID=2185142 RepID=UPI001F0765CB|nr:alpha/beta hydrolase [Altererythrobacter sp. ZODW24]
MPRGSLLFFPGRGDNYEKYLESLEEWARAGWRVTAADWRGQAGSGRLAGDAVTGHIDDFDTWLRDLGDFWKLWKSEREEPHILAGHSMGGHLVLRGLAEKYVDPDAMVLSAPMLGFIGRLPASVMHGGAKLLTKLKGATTPAWKWSEKPGEIPEGRERLLTHDDDRYADELFWREERPQLVMGPGSWGWVERSYASTRALFEPGVLEAINTPVYLLAATDDKLVAFDAIAEAAQRLPNGEMLQFGDEARHEILREVDAVRQRAMDGTAEFLDRVAPAKN